jgi:glycosyltransferase involved in cell wall biosynthesis
MTKVLLLTDITGNGGVTAHLCQLGSRAPSRGFKVSLLMDDAAGTDLSAAQLRAAGIAVTRAPLYHGHHPPSEVAQTVTAALRREAPEVVHVHCGSPRSALTAREVVLEAGLPLVTTEHYVSAAQSLSEEQLTRMRAVYARTFAVISVCTEHRQLLREHFKLRAERHVVIPGAITLPPIVVQQPPRDEPVRVLSVARLTPNKGVGVLIRAVHELRRRVPDSTLRLTVGSTGELESELKGLTQSLQLGEVVTFTGWVDDVYPLLQTHSLFVLPSLSDGQPLCLLEALAHGLPCIGSAVSGIPDTLGDGRFGDLVPPGNVAALAQCLRDHCADPDRLWAKAKGARAMLAERHDPDGIVKDITDWWSAALESGTKREKT